MWLDDFDVDIWIKDEKIYLDPAFSKRMSLSELLLFIKNKIGE